jgi:hypothetical protein
VGIGIVLPQQQIRSTPASQERSPGTPAFGMTTRKAKAKATANAVDAAAQ